MTTLRFTFAALAPFSAPGSTWPAVTANSLRHARLLYPELMLAALDTVQDHTGAVIWRAVDNVPWVDGCMGEVRR